MVDMSNLSKVEKVNNVSSATNIVQLIMMNNESDDEGEVFYNKEFVNKCNLDVLIVSL